MLRASAEIKTWSVQNSQYRLPRRWHLSRTRLCLKSGKYCHYTGKAWHIFVILGFLCSYMEPLDVEGDLKMLVWSGHTLMAFLHSKRKESLFLAQDDIRQVQVLGTYHLNLLLLAHQKFANFPTYKLFNIRPKFHSMCHILDFATSGKNPVSQACWMEEDWVRSVSVLAKRTQAKKTSLSTLQRYAAGQNIITRPISFKTISGRIEACLGKAAGHWHVNCTHFLLHCLRDLPGNVESSRLASTARWPTEEKKSCFTGQADFWISSGSPMHLFPRVYGEG